MFAIPQPVTGMEELGCPVVHLPESAEDWRHVIKALYDRSYYFGGDPPQPFSLIAAFARLGTKYEFGQLLKEAMKNLSILFPSRLEDMDNRLGAFPHILYEPSFIFNVISLAREMNLLFILPSALAECCRICEVDDILEGIKEQHGTPALLSIEDQAICLSGSRRLMHRQSEETFKWLDVQFEGALFPGCQNRVRCDIGRKKIFYSLSHPITRCIPLEPWHEHDWEQHMCHACIAASKAQHKRGLQNIWNELPSIFGLPGWDQLFEESL